MRENAKGLKVLKKEVLGLLHFTCWAGGEPHHAELDRVLGEVILIQEAVQLALHLAPPVVALAQRAHRAIHSLGVLPPAEVGVGDDQADRHLGGRAVPSSRRELRLRARRSPPAIGRGDDRAEDHEDLDPHLSSSSFPLPSAPLFPSLTRIEKRPFLLDPCFTSPSTPRSLLHTRVRMGGHFFLVFLLFRVYFDEKRIRAGSAIFFPRSGHRSKRNSKIRYI